MARIVSISTKSSDIGKKYRNTWYWIDKVRPEQLRREPTCRICNTKGRLTEAEEVDHVKPMVEGGAPYAFDNLQSLCKRCHVIKTATEQRHGGHRGHRGHRGVGEKFITE